MLHIRLALTLACATLAACSASPVCMGDEVRPYCDGRAIVDNYEIDGEVRVLGAACDDAWELRCDLETGSSTVPWVPCELATGDLAPCPGGGAAHCISAPCDGQSHYGPAHPLAP